VFLVLNVSPALVLRLWRLKWLCCHSCVGHSNCSSASVTMIRAIKT